MLTALPTSRRFGCLSGMSRASGTTRLAGGAAAPVKWVNVGNPQRYMAPMRGCALKSTSQDPVFSLHIGETTVQVPFSPSAAQGLRESFGSLLKTFSEKQKTERPRRLEIMEWRYQGTPGTPGIASFEVCCNPNAYPSAVEAKLLITIKTTDGVRIATEGRLSNFKSDFEAYLRERKAEQAAGKA